MMRVMRGRHGVHRRGVNPSVAEGVPLGLLAVLALPALVALPGCGGGAAEEGVDAVSQAICTGVKVSIAPTGILPSDSSALLTASEASCAAGEVPEYRFLYRREGGPATYTEFRGWSSEPTATFDNSDLPSGKYTLQVRARNVGSSAGQNSQATVAVSSGNICTPVTLSATPSSPQLPGGNISLSALATCSEGAAEYQFLVKAPDASGFTPLSGWAGPSVDWNTSGLELGTYSLKVFARGAGNTSKYESQRTLSYMLADRCGSVTVSFSPASPQPAGTLVGINAGATCAGGSTPEFRYDYRLKGTTGWTLLQNWSAEASATWNTAGLAGAVHQIRVQTRAPGATAAQASKSQDYTLTAPTCASATCGVSDSCCPSGCDAVDDLDCPALVATDLAVGEFTRCAVLSNDSIACWGANYYGVLGNGSNVTQSTVPVRVSGIDTATQVDVEGSACALLNDGQIMCWGSDSYGQLGNDEQVRDSSVPVFVAGIDSATAVATGQTHSCALLADATVRCWGHNYRGQLGNGTTNDSGVPVSVLGITNAVAIAASAAQSCALLADGTLSCWGDNFHHQLGALPIDPSCSCVLTPGNVGFSNAIGLSTYGSNTCALLSNHTIECVGRNIDGELGNGVFGGYFATPVQVSGITTASSVSAGGCATLLDGSARCWGWGGNDGRLGDGTPNSSAVPVTVQGIDTAVSIGVGGCALLASGSVRCWGDGSKGSLGNGETLDSYVPVTVSGF